MKSAMPVEDVINIAERIEKSLLQSLLQTAEAWGYAAPSLETRTKERAADPEVCESCARPKVYPSQSRRSHVHSQSVALNPMSNALSNNCLPAIGEAALVESNKTSTVTL